MRPDIKTYIIYGMMPIILLTTFSCKKLLEIPPPNSTITSQEVFSTDAQAEQAVTGVYFGMIGAGNTVSAFKNAITIYTGTSSDEFKFFNNGVSQNIQFQNNTLLSTNSFIDGSMWAPMYSTIYRCNSVIEGLEASAAVHDSLKNELVGETEFVRAYANFYLVNLYGPVPLVTTINYNKTATLPNANTNTIYTSIIADLKDAGSRMAQDYSASNGQRIVPNRWAAIALLARVYLYNGDWADAQKQATLVINNSSQYSLAGDLNNIFLSNSSEAIWQLQQPNGTGTLNATPEAYEFIPRTLTSQPTLIYLTPSLMNAFEKGDQRRLAWIDSTRYLNVNYYFPYKYKVGVSQAKPNGAYSEYYMVLRLAEQYLIRAEAEAQLGDVADAAADLNIIRNRAGLPNTTASAQSDLLAAIAHENRIEFFAEWGHRWLDLKRTGQALQVLNADKGNKIDDHDLLYPIPVGELSKDPDLTQNPGY